MPVRLLFVALLAGCTPGTAPKDTLPSGGTSDAATDTSPTGDRSTPRAEPTGYFWADATGAVALPDPFLVYFDADGLAWPVSIETGQPEPSADLSVYYDDYEACMEDRAWVLAPPPRYPFRIRDLPGLYVRRDDALGQERAAGGATINEPGWTPCESTISVGKGWTVSLDDLEHLDFDQPPVLDVVPPLHPVSLREAGR